MPADEPSVRVLLVDDEDLICRTLLRLFKGQDRFAIHSATNYRDALKVLQTHGPFHILLTDLQLHDVPGVELAKRFLRVDPDLKVVFMSGDVPRDFAAAYVTLEKPFDRDDLFMALEFALATPHRKLV